MTRILLIGVAVVLGVAASVSNPVLSVALAVGAWAYVVRMVSRQENSVVQDQMKTKVKKFLIIGAVSLFVFLAGAIAHNVLHGLGETEEAVFLSLSIVASLVFVVATAGGVALYFKERQKTI